jgi:hypothetical protein
VSREEVLAVYEQYLKCFIRNDIAGIDALVEYPLTYIGPGEVRQCDEFPIDPGELIRMTGWHTTLNMRYEVVAVSAEKAHVVLHHGERVREDGSLIETVSGFYAFKRTGEGWKMYALSDLIL